MVSFRHEDAAEIAARCKVFSLAESLGGVESLIEVPQAMTHQSVEGSAAAVPADLVRLSCGIEEAEDLIEDLAQAIGVTSRSVGDRFTWEMRYVLPVILFALLAPAAQAYPKLPNPLPPVKGNPANTFLDSPIEDFRYDAATHCKNARNPGITALANWLGAHTRGVFWGSYRCEKWGKHPPPCTPRTARSTGTWTPSTGPTSALPTS